ncbi:hypothetical protein [Clostridium sp. DL1XJH146]
MSYKYTEVFLYHEWENNVLNDIYLPEPFDEKQKNVIKNIESNYIVSMDFETDDFKINAITNFLHYFLEKQKNVLFVSNGKNVIDKIKQKIPNELKNFYSNNFNEKDNFIKNVISTLNTVQHNKEYDLSTIDYSIQVKLNELESCREEQGKIKDNISEIKKLVNANYKFKGKKYTIEDIRNWVKYNEKDFSWIDDRIEIGQLVPISDAKFSKMIYLFSNIKKGDYTKYLKYKDIINSLINIEDILCLLNEYKNIKANIDAYIAMGEEYKENANYIINNKQVFNLLFKNLRYFDDDDYKIIRKCLLKFQNGDIGKEELNQKILKINYYYKKIRRLNRSLNSHTFKIPEDIEIDKLQEDAQTIYRNMKSNNNFTIKYKIFHNNTRYLFESVYVDEKKIDNKSQFQLLCKYIDKIIYQKEFDNLLEKVCSIIEVKYKGYNVYQDIESTINKAEKVINIQDNIDLLKKFYMGIKTKNNIDWYKKDTYINLINGINGLQKLRKYKLIQEKIELFLEQFSGKLEGNAENNNIINNDFIDKLIHELNVVIDLKKEIELLEKIDQTINILQSICPLLIQELDQENNRTDMLVRYRSFNNAWSWTKFKTLLDKLDSYNLNNQTKSLYLEKEKEKDILKKISILSIWEKYLYNVEDENLNYLMNIFNNYKNSNFEDEISDKEYKVLINDNYEKLQKLIPIWIMTIDEVNDYIKYRNDNFDVLIFDKSTDVETSLNILLMKTEKVIILGSLNNKEKALLVQNNIKEYSKGIA